MTRLVRNVMRQKRMTKHVEVAHCVQNLVLDELVVLAQAARIENAELVHHDGVLERTALSEPHAAKHLHVLHETERAGARDRLLVRDA